MRPHRLVLPLLTFASSVLAAFGFTKSGSNYDIDAGSSNSLVFTVNGGSCDITSIKYRGTELQDSQGTHLSSGLGTATVTVESITASSVNYVKVTCTTSTLTHYTVVKEGESNIYLATFIKEEPSVGELRFIARLKSSILSEEYPFGNASTTAGSSSTVEGSDVFVVNGETRSKFYSSARFIDKDAHCVYGGSDVTHVCVLAPHPESSSGGPFFRDIETNNAGAATNLYWYMNSGHVQTEAFRTNVLHGPYILTFSRSGIPKLRESDTSFFSGLGITGYVPESGRGYVSGTASGVSTSFQNVVHWFNAEAQYWAIASSNGAFTSPAMKPGTYTMILYQGEYKVASATGVSVTAGKTTSKSIASTETTRNSLWKIGEYDGKPTGFLNADKFLRMHPSDSRMAAWNVVTYTIGTSTLSQFPMALFKNVNNPVTIKFKLASAPGSATLRIATTLSFNGARPQAQVNSWTGSAPAAPQKIDSRGVTRGAYRGYGEVYDVSIPSGTLVAGDNTITITAISGSSGTTFLNPNFIFDAVELFT
ncbi:polysaccharide lyase family 4 protein [Durotheca rogersii]|uniref:polysaccharide lyase family 4 protein n=1 Tax=Durotheca rogersii TaxID=419775 RepID=UPI00221E3FC1|nr:polysaccharide lyase family 4 protein [Durotheca rogersii]KAI5860905.1 polysaccharide lyase family 4 protein [Durotheca rogersii]